MKELKEELEDFVRQINALLDSDSLTEFDISYFEGKLVAYECVIEMIEKGNVLTQEQPNV